MELSCSLERCDGWPVVCVVIYWLNIYILQCCYMLSPFLTFCLLVPYLIFMVIYRDLECNNLKSVWGKEWIFCLLGGNIHSPASLKIWARNWSSVKGHVKVRGKRSNVSLLVLMSFPTLTSYLSSCIVSRCKTRVCHFSLCVYRFAHSRRWLASWRLVLVC